MREEGRVSRRKSFLYYLIGALIIMGLLIYGVVVLKGEHYYIISMAVMLTGITAGVLGFEGRASSATYISCLVVFIVIAVLSRLMFAPLPQVKPIAAFVILAGIALGKEAGFMAGAMSMFISNFFFMQGSWTPFQMFALGTVGFFSGLFFFKNEDMSMKQRLIVSAYGFFSVLIIYGIIVDINTVFFAMGDEPTFYGVLGVYIAALPLNLIFAATTAVVLFLIYPWTVSLWKRLVKKYEV